MHNDEYERVGQGVRHAIAEASAPAPKFKGEAVELGGVTYIVPPLALGALKHGLLDRIRSVRLEGGMPPLDLVLEVVLAALKRNYPELTMAELEELDAGEITRAFEAFVVIVELSGFAPRKSEDPSGNGQSGRS